MPARLFAILAFLCFASCTPRTVSEPATDQEGPSAGETEPLVEQLTFAEAAADSLTGPNAEAWMHRMDARHEELADALEQAIEDRASETALRLATALSPYWERKSEVTAARATLDRALAIDDAPTPARAAALLEAGYFAFRQEDQAGARTAHEAALRIYETLADEHGAALAHVNLSRVALRAQDYDAVTEHVDRATATFEQTGDRAGIAGARHMLATSAEMRGDLTEAAALYEELYRLQRELGNPFQEAIEQYNLASVRLRMGALDEAEAMLTESLALSLSVGDELAVPFALLRFSALALERGEPERGARLLGAAVAQFEAQEVSMDPAEQSDYDGYRTRLREALGDAAFESAFAAGRAMASEKALAFATSGR